VFKDYCKNIGWTWGGITNIEGEPINDEFAPRGSSHIRYAFNDGHLYLGRVSHSELAIKAATENPLRDNACYGWITVGGDKAQVWPVHVAAIPSLCEWAEDQSLTLYAGNDNVIKTIEDLEVENTGANWARWKPPKNHRSVTPLVYTSARPVIVCSRAGSFMIATARMVAQTLSGK